MHDNASDDCEILDQNFLEDHQSYPIQSHLGLHRGLDADDSKPSLPLNGNFLQKRVMAPQDDFLNMSIPYDQNGKNDAEQALDCGINMAPSMNRFANGKQLIHDSHHSLS